MIEQRIKQVMGAVFGIDPATISELASPGNIDAWDSLRHMNLIIALEEEFGIRFDDRDAYDLVSFKLLAFAIKQLLDEQNGGGSAGTKD